MTTYVPKLTLNTTDFLQKLALAYRKFASHYGNFRPQQHSDHSLSLFPILSLVNCTISNSISLRTN